MPTEAPVAAGLGAEQLGLNKRYWNVLRGLDRLHDPRDPGGPEPGDAAYNTGDLDIADDSISQWSGHVVTIFLR